MPGSLFGTKGRAVAVSRGRLVADDIAEPNGPLGNDEVGAIDDAEVVVDPESDTTRSEAGRCGRANSLAPGTEYPAGAMKYAGALTPEENAAAVVTVVSGPYA